jgi:hypothetical protein
LSYRIGSLSGQAITILDLGASARNGSSSVLREV